MLRFVTSIFSECRDDADRKCHFTTELGWITNKKYTFSKLVTSHENSLSNFTKSST